MTVSRSLAKSAPILPAAIMLLLIAACTEVHTGKNIWPNMNQRGIEHGFRAVLFDAGMFQLSGLLRNQGGASGELVVYIEGDGHTVDQQGRVRENPTPPFAQAYELALLDPGPQVLYLARIGQFNNLQTGNRFKKYWTHARFSPEALEAAGQAIDQAKELSGAHHVQLIGFSGGGALATLLAEKRNDVTSLVTVAALLDTAWWANFHLPKTRGASFSNAFSMSLNPAKQASVISSLPQMHFSGSEDELIPPQMVKQFQNAANFTNFRQIILPNKHNQGWSNGWPNLLIKYVIPLRIYAAVSEAA